MTCVILNWNFLIFQLKKNLLKHIENIREVYSMPTVVAINRFLTDTDEEVRFVSAYCEEKQVECAYSEVFAKGGEGGITLAETVCRVIDERAGQTHFAPIYADDTTIYEKIEAVAKQIYHAGDVSYTPAAKRAVREIESLGMGNYPVCVAKTQYSLSDDPTLLGAPEGFTLNVRDIRVNAGARFIVVYTGSIVTMPGLPKVPAAERIDVTEDGVIEGLF